MKRYALLFRMDITTPSAQPSPKQMNIYMQHWTEWVSMIEEAGQMTNEGNHFSRQGRVLRPRNEREDKPYSADHLSVAGYIIIFAKNMKGATEIAERCPILKGEKTSVEIREVESR